LIKVLKEVSKKDLENFIYEIDIKDENLYIEANNPNKIGIFQISGKTAERLCQEIHPDNFEELMAVNAISRPGPLETAGPFYVDRKSGEDSEYPDVVKEILKETHETFVFQEQIMEVSQKIGGFTLDEANELRSVMKKLAKSEKREEDLKKWDKIVKKFIKSSSTLGINEEMAKKIANDMAAFSGYSFCKAHASSYTYIAVITLYLSFYFRKYFYSSILEYESENKSNYLLERINSVRSQGIKILPPDINKSKEVFSVEGENIRLGLKDIKFVSDKALEIIMPNRPYKSIFDFLFRASGRPISIKVITALISVGAFDSLFTGRKKLLSIIEQYWKMKKSNKVEEKLKAIYDKCCQSISSLPALDDTLEDFISYEKEFLGYKIFSSQFTDNVLKKLEELARKKLIYRSFSEVKENSKKVPVIINSIKPWTDKNKNSMAFIEFEDLEGKIFNIPIFSSYWKFIGDQFETEKLYIINVYRDSKGYIMFGQSSWTDSEFKICRMVKKIT
jgi:DNA polymerase III subunit alpha